MKLFLVLLGISLVGQVTQAQSNVSRGSIRVEITSPVKLERPNASSFGKSHHITIASPLIDSRGFAVGQLVTRWEVDKQTPAQQAVIIEGRLVTFPDAKTAQFIKAALENCVSGTNPLIIEVDEASMVHQAFPISCRQIPREQ